MMNRKSLSAMFGVSLFVLALAPSAAGHDNAAKTTYLSFSQSVRLPGVALRPGTYIFELADPGNSSVVRVMSRDRKGAYFMGFTTPVERPGRLHPKATVSLGESEAGAAPPITTWWPIGESTGRAFMYR